MNGIETSQRCRTDSTCDSHDLIRHRKSCDTGERAGFEVPAGPQVIECKAPLQCARHLNPTKCGREQLIGAGLECRETLAKGLRVFFENHSFDDRA